MPVETPRFIKIYIYIFFWLGALVFIYSLKVIGLLIPKAECEFTHSPPVFFFPFSFFHLRSQTFKSPLKSTLVSSGQMTNGLRRVVGIAKWSARGSLKVSHYF